MDKVRFFKTKSGKGYGIVIDDKTWLYTSKDNVLAVVRNEAKSCQFQEIENKDSSMNPESPVEDSSKDESPLLDVYSSDFVSKAFEDFPLTD